jgi:hypothetical protein
MKVKIKSKVGTKVVSVGFGGKEYIVKFEKPDFIAEVPTEVFENDTFGKRFLFNKNLAQHLLNVYPSELELVEEIPEPAVVAPKIAEKKSKVKEKTNE